MNKTAVFFTTILLAWAILLPTFLDPSKINDTQSKKEVIEIIKEEVVFQSEIDGIKIGKDGVIGSKEVLEAEIVVDFFFDPACVSCAHYNDVVGPLMTELIEKKDIGVVFHPVPYLNEQTPDDYSNRASAYMFSVAEYAPEKALSYIQAVLNEDFIPENPGKDMTPDSKFVEAMKIAGLTSEEIEKVEENKEGFVSIAIAAGKEFIESDSKWVEFSSMKNKNEEKVVFTPFVLINNNGEYENSSLDLEGDLIFEFEKMIEKISN